MIYTDFQDKKLSMLGFGAMRLPTLDKGQIDENQVIAMVDMAMANGVNYFDTAFPYHGGLSEVVMGKALSRYPRQSFYLATKYPGHQIASTYDPADVFEQQLKKCQVEYFDFYLLHNVYEESMGVYLDPRWGILDYFRKQKEMGRIKHLGFSTHGGLDNMKAFLDIAGKDMEFCQIQLNWLDWTLQKAKEKVALLNERNIPIWVMEPLRGGRLCKLSDKEEQILEELRPGKSIPDWSLRFLQDVPGVKVVLSGMSSLDQMEKNINSFASPDPLTPSQRQALFSIAQDMKDWIPCTGCGYCADHCPQGLNIPLMMATANDLRFAENTTSAMQLEALPADHQPDACLECGQCAAMCPQKIHIPDVLKELAERLQRIPKWKDVCREREEAARRLRG